MFKRTSLVKAAFFVSLAVHGSAGANAFDLQAIRDQILSTNRSDVFDRPVFNRPSPVPPSVNGTGLITFNDQSPLFTDPTPVASGTRAIGRTVGEQRLVATAAAVRIIESQLRITQPVQIEFQTNEFRCGLYGVGTYNRSLINGRNQIRDTVYPVALANQLSQVDLTPPGTADVLVTLNSNILTGQCPQFFDYSITPPSMVNIRSIDFIDLLLHEISHGLGFEVRPAGQQLPFVFERFLFAKDENSVFGILDDSSRAAAAAKTKNVVFTGALTKELSRRLLRTRSILSVRSPSGSLDIDVNEVAATPAISQRGIDAPAVFLDFNTCESLGNLTGSIVFMPSGCARRELGFNGTQFDGIALAEREGARAVVVGSGGLPTRLSSFVTVGIPVATLELSDYQRIQALASDSASARLSRDFSSNDGTDEEGHPFVFTGPGVPSGVKILHFDPSVNINATRGGLIGRALQEPVVSSNGADPASRTLDLNLPALIDIGWAARSCGNLVVEQYEQCDDGNMINGDGCEQNCLLPQ